MHASLNTPNNDLSYFSDVPNLYISIPWYADTFLSCIWKDTQDSNLFRVSYQSTLDLKNLLSHDITIDLKRACVLGPDLSFLFGTLRLYVKKCELSSLLVNRSEVSHPS